jgi:hypothetical protein
MRFIIMLRAKKVPLVFAKARLFKFFGRVNYEITNYRRKVSEYRRAKF